MKFFETFAGVGGFGIGIQNAYAKNKRMEGDGQKNIRLSERQETEHSTGTDIPLPERSDGRPKPSPYPECVGYSEIDKYASQVLKYHYPNIKNYGDITKINWSEVPDFDLLTGGSPCQDFSIAGKRAGIEGARSGLVWEYIRCLEEKKPKYFIWENVRGVISSRRGFDFGNILTAFSESGYSLWWQVLNAKDFGVPQNRERIFVVGFRDGCPPEVFFERGTDAKDIQNLEPGANQANRRYNTDGISPTVPTSGGGRHIPMIQSVAIRTRTYNNQPARLEISKDEASNTVSSVPKDYMIMNMHISARDPKRKNAHRGGVGATDESR